MNLYLDDLRTTPEGFERVYSYEEFVAYLQHYGLPDFISFDHDLGEEFSGYDCAKYLVVYYLDRQLPLPKFVVHSQNPVGKANIEQLLANFKKKYRILINKTMAKKEQLLRLVHIVKALEKAPEEGLSYQELYDYLKQKHEDKDCGKFSFSEKTFQRDRHLLEDIFMIYIAPNGKGRWVIEESELTNRYAIFDNILLVDAYRRTKEMQEVLLFERQEKTLGLNHIEEIIEAIEKHRTMRFFYTKFWEGVARQREMVPYTLKEHNRRWYLIVAEHKEPIQFKAFGLDRISQLEVTSTKVQRKKVNIEALFKNTYGVMIDMGTPPQEIILSFDYEQGQYIKTLPLHPSQKLLEDNEDEVRISLLLVPTYNFVMEICARSQYVKVLAPATLAEEVREHLKKAYEQYL